MPEENKNPTPVTVIVMGVCGCGKSTVGENLSELLAAQFLDADDFHPESNLKKLRAGTPLQDEDRMPWLRILQKEISTRNQAGQSVVLACSALKEMYRTVLLEDNASGHVLYLKGSFRLLEERLASRGSHFMNADLLQSQLDALEEPLDAIVVDIQNSPDEIAKIALAQIFPESVL